MRIGFGYDNHRLTEKRPLMLGGILIPSEKGEDAHSDGDVLIHAIIDAILGAASMRDIGYHFPPSDAKYKDASSLDLLKKTMALTRAEIINLDATVILEKIKLKDYIDSIRESLSTILSVSIDRISVKAKTHEGLDATGKGDAIEAYAVVLLNNS